MNRNSKQQQTKAKGRDAKTPIKLSTGRKIAFSAIIFFGFFGFLEASLRILGLGKPPIVGQLRFGYDTGVPLYDNDGIEREGEVYQDLPLFEYDNELFWKPIPNTPYTGPSGLRLPEPRLDASKASAFTILVLGDSCSFLGERPYPARLAQLLKPKQGRELRVLNASCPGYSSQQGVVMLDRFKSIKPDLTLVYFGWNDHWNSLNGCSDRELIERTQFVRATQSFLSPFHLYWALRSSIGKNQPKPNSIKVTPRVPLEDFLSNMQSIIQKVEAWDGRALLITAPSAFEPNRMPPWAYPFFSQYYQMSTEQIAAIPATHTLYAEQIRTAVDGTRHAQVCDLEKNTPKEASYFRSDCIHLSESGHQVAAEQIAAAIRQMFPDEFE